MKFLIKIVIAFFILFQFSSVIICLINEKNDADITYNINEEEEQQQLTKEIKTEVVFERNSYDHFIVEETYNNTFYFYLLKEYSSTLQSFFSPPEQV